MWFALSRDTDTTISILDVLAVPFSASHIAAPQTLPNHLSFYYNVTTKMGLTVQQVTFTMLKQGCFSCLFQHPAHRGDPLHRRRRSWRYRAQFRDNLINVFRRRHIIKHVQDLQPLEISPLT